MVWNVATGVRLAWLRSFAPVFAVAVSRNRQVAATGSSGGEILLWDLDTGERSATLEGHERSVQALAFSPDGGGIASASDDGTVRVWDLSRISHLPRLRDHPHGAGSVEFSQDGDRIVTSSGDETVWLWDARSGAPVACLNDRATHYLEGGPPIPAVAIRVDRVFSHLRGEVWSAATGTRLRSSDDRHWALTFVGRRTVWSPDGSKVAAFGSQEWATISWTADLHVQPLCLHGHGGSVTAAAFSPDSRLLATGSFDRTVRVWDAGTGTEVACLHGHDQAVSCVAFSPDGRFIASGAADRTLRVRDLTTGRESLRIDINEPGEWCSRWSRESGCEDLYAIRAVAFTHDGRQLVTDCGDDFRLWDIGAGTPAGAFVGRAGLDALAAAWPYQAFIRESELVIERYTSSTEAARVPVTTRCDPVTHPGGQIWAVGGRWLRLFALSGPAA
jgi:WD40 repeat protein